VIRGSEVELFFILEGSSISDVGGRHPVEPGRWNVAIYRSESKPRSCTLILDDRSQVGLD
jgi:hypothetical protein